MTDLLIRDVPEVHMRGIDANAAAEGLGRPEYLRRLLAQDAMRARVPMTVSMADLTRLAALTSDTLSPDFEQRAWS